MNSFLKIIPPGSYSFLEQPTQIVKVSSRGLRGYDLQEFIKRSSYQFANDLKHLIVKEGDVPVHLLAFGATEVTGPNRNGDGFKKVACRRYHDTFQKYSRFYRNHVNKDPAKSYGLVKLSTYNEDMGRVELLAILNGNKAAADRNGGLIADKEMEKLAVGNDIPVSMSCSVSADYCSGCDHRARNRDEYCDEGICKRGGLKNHITRVDEDGHMLHADNRDPRFFDISHVPKGADRIAYVVGQVKSASGAVLSGADLASKVGMVCPYDILVEGMEFDVARQVKTAYVLADLEKRLEEQPAFAESSLNRALDQDLRLPLEGLDFYNRLSRSRQDALNALTATKIAMTLPEFMILVQQLEPAVAQERAVKVADHVPGIYSRLVKDGNLEFLVTNYGMLFSDHTPVSVQNWAVKQAASCSLAQPYVEQRIRRSVLRGCDTPRLHQAIRKSASVQQEPDPDTDTEAAARAYALYKLAFLSYWEKNPEATPLLELTLRQNYLPLR